MRSRPRVTANGQQGRLTNGSLRAPTVARKARSLPRRYNSLDSTNIAVLVPRLAAGPSSRFRGAPVWTYATICGF